MLNEGIGFCFQHCANVSSLHYLGDKLLEFKRKFVSGKDEKKDGLPKNCDELKISVL